MLILERLIRLYAPLLCVGCGAESDRLLCLVCCETIPSIPSRCYRCRSVSRDYATCAACRKVTPLRHVYVGFHHDGLPKELLHRAKYERAAAGLSEMAELLRPHAVVLPQGVVLVHIPTATSRVRQRGHDQAEVLARLLAAQVRMSRVCALARLGQAHQVGSTRAERMAHLHGALRIKDSRGLRGAHVVLVDDVVTTGATLETAARALKRAGVKRVDALVFAQAG